MSEQLRETLSALKDGEAEELELRRLLKQGDSHEVDEQWKMMHHLSEVVEGRTPQFAQWDISKQVSAAIDEESAHQTDFTEERESHSFSARLLKPFAGFAVAASVALALVFGTQTLNTVEPGLSTPISNGGLASSGRVYPATMSANSLGSVNVNAVSSGSNSPLSNTDTVASLSKVALKGDLAAEQRLNQYMMQHTEQSALNNGQGMLNFARVASFEVE